MKSMKKVAQEIREGKSVLLFPEGHRSRNGQLLPFKAGSFYIAILAGVPIVPITVNGTSYVLKPDTYHVRAGQTEMIVHPPISTAGADPARCGRPFPEGERRHRLALRVGGRVIGRSEDDRVIGLDRLY